MTRLICASCHRPLLNPNIMRGSQAFGPVCAKRMGLPNPKKTRKSSKKIIFFDEKQLDLFDESQEKCHK
jgi:hypothetical protein